MVAEFLSHYNMYCTKICAGIFAGIAASFTNDLMPLFVIVLIFEVADFGTGVWKSAVVAKRSHKRFAFQSVKAWRTIVKLALMLLVIFLSEMLGKTLAEDGERWRLANYMTGFLCGVEMWSVLENAAVISEHPVFKWLRKFMKFKVEDKLGMKFEDAQDETTKGENQ